MPGDVGRDRVLGEQGVERSTTAASSPALEASNTGRSSWTNRRSAAASFAVTEACSHSRPSRRCDQLVGVAEVGVHQRRGPLRVTNKVHAEILRGRPTDDRRPCSAQVRRRAADTRTEDYCRSVAHDRGTGVSTSTCPAHGDRGRARGAARGAAACHVLRRPPPSSNPVLANVPCLLARGDARRPRRSHPAERRGWSPPAVGIGCSSWASTSSSSSDGPARRRLLTQLRATSSLYPLPAGGLLLALREHLRHARLIVALDGLSGALAGAAVTACAIAPLSPRCSGTGSTAAIGVLATRVRRRRPDRRVTGSARHRRPQQGTQLPGVGPRACWSSASATSSTPPGSPPTTTSRHLARQPLGHRPGRWSRWVRPRRAEPQAAIVPPARSLVVVRCRRARRRWWCSPLAPDWQVNPVPTVLALLRAARRAASGSDSPSCSCGSWRWSASRR